MKTSHIVDAEPPLLSAEAVEVRYRDAGGRATVHAVRGVSFDLRPGAALGIVGESGCGKSSLAYALAGLNPTTAGQVVFRGRPVTAMRAAERLDYRRAVQIVFQDPLSSLNPRLTVGQALAEVLVVHRARNGLDRAARNARVIHLLEETGLSEAFRDRYPHELSGGQRQRVGIARALALDPEVLIADEPVSSLDVSVQVQILNLLRRLNETLGVALVLIAHDLAVVRYLCSEVVVMYLGRVVEQGPAATLFESCRHPYTEALLSAVPDIDRTIRGGGRARRIILRGDTPSSAMRVPGCPFHPRCHRAKEVCAEAAPLLKDTGDGPQRVACHFPVHSGGVGDLL